VLWICQIYRLLIEIIYQKLVKTPFYSINDWSNRDYAIVQKAVSTLDLPHRKILLKYMKMMFNFDSPIDVLDVGGGVGSNVINCAGQFTNCSFQVLEIQKKAIEVGQAFANSKKMSNIQFTQADVRFYNFQNDKYDLIFVDAVFLYLNDIESKLLLRNLIRSSKKYIIIVDFNFTNRFLRTTYRIRDGYIHNFYKSLSSESIRKIKISKIEESGFTGRWNHFGSIIEIEIEK
jgi:ubiquinone/menaquinone biosynthesis C-methylase UbiE